MNTHSTIKDNEHINIIGLDSDSDEMSYNNNYPERSTHGHKMTLKTRIVMSTISLATATIVNNSSHVTLMLDTCNSNMKYTNT